METYNNLTYNSKDVSFLPEASFSDQYAISTQQVQHREIRSSERVQRVKRPRNAFIIFRSEFNTNGDKINRNVENDSRHISRIIGYYWKQLPEEEKTIWKKKAEVEKLDHMRKYPNYKYAPSTRGSKKPTRNVHVKRNAEEDIRRCHLVANLLLQGKEGEDLQKEVQAAYLTDHKVGDTGSRSTPIRAIVGPNMRQALDHDQQLQSSSQKVHPYMVAPGTTSRQTYVRHDDATHRMDNYWEYSPSIDTYYHTDIQSTSNLLHSGGFPVEDNIGQWQHSAYHIQPTRVEGEIFAAPVASWDIYPNIDPVQCCLSCVPHTCSSTFNFL